MEMYLASQLFAACALALGVRAYLHPQDKSLKLYIGAAALCMAVHFACLHAWVGAALSLVGAARYISAGYSKSAVLYYVFLLSGLAIGTWRYQTLPDALPLIAHTVACYALFNLHGRALRVSLLVVTSCWLSYNALNHSVVGMVLEAFYLATNAANLIRTNRKTVTAS